MARPNAPRSIGGEANLAERFRFERERRGWSPAELARRLTAEGCSIATSAIYKIEADARRITVDELVAASQVFEVTVTDLLTPLELVRQERAREIVKKLERAESDLEDAIARFTNFYVELFELAAEGDRELYDYVMNLSHSRNGSPGAPAEPDADSPLFTVETEGGVPLAVSDAALRDAYLDLLKAMIETASDAVTATHGKGKHDGKHQEA